MFLSTLSLTSIRPGCHLSPARSEVGIDANAHARTAAEQVAQRLFESVTGNRKPGQRPQPKLDGAVGVLDERVLNERSDGSDASGDVDRSDPRSVDGTK